MLRTRVLIAASALLILAGLAFAQAPARQAADTQLHQAARTGDLTVLRVQLQQGTNPNVTDSQGRTALIDAVRAGQTEAVKVLIEAGADVNLASTNGRTALIEAAEEGRTDAAKLLIQHGADLNAAPRTGSALATAERTGHNDIAALLRQAGAQSTGHSLGDTVCVRPWGGNGFCGVVETLDKNDYRLRVTQIVGCKEGCPARDECSANKPVGGSGGIAVGDQVDTKSWCLTHTGVK